MKLWYSNGQIISYNLENSKNNIVEFAQLDVNLKILKIEQLKILKYKKHQLLI